jgi:hypothetical protein
MAATAGALDGVHGWDEVDGLRDTMSRTLRLVGIHLALAAMLLRAMLPDGWMPGPANTSGVPIELCTVSGPVNVAVGEDGKLSKQIPAQNDGRHTDVCPFAAAPHFVTMSPTVVLAPRSAEAFLTPRLLQSSVVDAAQRHTPQSPRAPPSFV